MGLFDLPYDIGNAIKGEDDQQKKADADRDAALAAYQGLATPGIDEQRVNPYTQGDTAYGGIQVDPREKEAQFAALRALTDQANQGGMTAQDRETFQQSQDLANQQEQSNRAALAQHYQSMGQLGQGAQLAMQLQGQQGAANRLNRAGMSQAAQAQMRALQARMGAGQLGGEMRGQDYGEQAAKAAAQDRINQFNTANRNQGQYYNSGLYQQQYDNQARRAGGLAGAYDSRANAYDQRSAQQRQQGQRVGQDLNDTANQVIQVAGNYQGAGGGGMGGMKKPSQYGPYSSGYSFDPSYGGSY
jgi:hypothetical protein